MIKNDFADKPFPTRLALLFDGLTDTEFLKYGWSWRERLSGYFDLMSNPKIVDVVEPEIVTGAIILGIVALDRFSHRKNT